MLVITPVSLLFVSISDGHLKKYAENKATALNFIVDGIFFIAYSHEQKGY